MKTKLHEKSIGVNEVINKEFIFQVNMPFECCHASNLTLLQDGSIMAAWFAGSEEGADDVEIWSSKRQKGEWSSPIEITHDEELPHWNPILYAKEDGTVLLFYKVGRIISEWYTKLKISKDNGVTWSESIDLVEGDRGGRGPVRNKVIKISDGTMLAPGSTENGIWKAFADRSIDGGRSWEKSTAIAIKNLEYIESENIISDISVTDQSFKGKGVIQPTFWESEAGKVHALLRSTEGKIYKSDSDDGGKNWSCAYPTVLPNNNSGIDVVKLSNGALVLAYNPVGVNWGPRTPMQLSASLDNGQTWGNNFVLEDEEGEYSYPSIISDGESIFVTYTWKRKNIAFWEISINDYFKKDK